MISGAGTSKSRHFSFVRGVTRSHREMLLVFLLVIWSAGVNSAFSEDVSILQKLEDVSARLEQAEKNSLLTERKFVALKGCMHAAISESAGNPQALEDSLKKLIPPLALLAQLCVAGDLKCAIDSVRDRVGELEKSQAQFTLLTIKTFAEFAEHSAQQMQSLAKKLDVCLQ